MYSIISIRILCLTYLARENPDECCESMLQKNEWQILYRAAKQTNQLPSKPPTIKEAVDYIAKLGGFLGRKGDDFPGVKVIWRGLNELNIIVKYYNIFNPN